MTTPERPPFRLDDEEEADYQTTPACGHTTKPCTDQRTWCPQCATPPCSRHLEHLHLAESWDCSPGAEVAAE